MKLPDELYGISAEIIQNQKIIEDLISEMKVINRDEEILANRQEAWNTLVGFLIFVIILAIVAVLANNL